MKKYDLSIVGIVGIPARYGGFETFVEHFVKWSSNKLDIRVFCSSKEYRRSERVSYYKGVKLNYIGIRANGSMSILYDFIGLISAMYSSRVILVLGVSGGIFFPFVKLFSKSKLLVNIDGLEWRRAKWSFGTRVFLKFSERIAVKFADEVIVDNAVLATYVKENYQKSAHTIAYGGDHLLESLIGDQEDNLDIDFLAIARIEPENNIHVILEAFKENQEKSLTFIGNWKNNEYSRNLYKKFQNESNIHLIEPIYDNLKLAKYRKSANAYVHGHSAGGTNPSLVEAIFYEIPILAYDCIFNRSTLDDTGYYWANASQLSELIKKVHFADSSKLKECYTWERISQSYLEIID